jgi:tyrosyl-tRNA synthetase
LPLLSFLSLSEIGDLLQRHGRQPERRLPQHALAEQLTLLVHGEDGLRMAKTATGILYENDASALAKLSLGEVSQCRIHLLTNAPQ